MPPTKIKVLEVISSMGPGGVENVMYNYISHFNHESIQCDFTCFIDANGVMREKFESLGAHIYQLPKKRHVFKCIHTLKKIIKLNHYDIIHIHLSFDSTIPLIASFLARAKIRIVHYHDDILKPSFLIRLSNFVNKLLSTHVFFCSRAAFYHNGFTDKKRNMYVPNILDYKKYLFNLNTRAKLRKKFNIGDNKTVVGFVGRLTWKKNPLFFVEIANRMQDYKDYVFFLVGSGPQENDIRRMIEEKKLTNIVFPFGNTDAYMYYNVFDILLFPSVLEGFGLVLTEAEINGLKVIRSNTVPEEADYRKNAISLPLTKYDDWVDVIKTTNIKREDFSGKIFNNSGLNSHTSYRVLENAYIDLIKEKGEKQ